MNKILIVISILAVCLSGCSSGSSGSFNDDGNGDKKCEVPSNPYNDAGGHDAGFNWAEEKDVSSCGGNSDSFIEGCEEYLRQQEKYNNCINN